MRAANVWGPFQHKGPQSSVLILFEGSLAQNLVLASVSGKFRDTYSTRAPLSNYLPFFDGSLARNGVPGDLSHNLFLTLSLSDRSPCGAVPILSSLPQPSCHLIILVYQMALAVTRACKIARAVARG